ncbi:MAG: type-F conjugative transfer system protein TraW [Alphaproteobacteria bacterium]|nr:type-F conjugative transfer system protein TraW [Alphaproteobacteria bacterium]
MKCLTFNTTLKGSVYINLCLFLLCTESAAKDFGVQGATVAITERSLLEVIEEKLVRASKTGQLASIQKEAQEKVSKKAQNPTRVKNIHKTTKSRRFHFDPTLTVDHDIKDHQGQIIHPKGTRINPLETLSWGEPLVFLDGEDENQVNWVLKHHPKAKFVLIGGKPLDLSKQYQKRFYFDQGGALIKKFKIQQVPARVSQEGYRLLIEEILVQEKCS